MALRTMLLGSRTVKNCFNPKIGLWGTSKQNVWSIKLPCCCCSSLLQRNWSSICGGTSIYEGSQRDEWIISLAKFAVNHHNLNEMWKNFMELLLWKPVHDAFLVIGIKRGDLQLHEAVMFYMNQLKRDFPRT